MTQGPPGEFAPVCADQADIVAFLSSPETFGGAEVTRIDTHLSHVFLAGPRAYKMKRALRYDFVDFSTPDLRRRACEREVEINRRTAPGMYLGVIALYRNENGPGWRGAGAPVEWAVEMKRFEADRQLDRLARRGALEATAIARLADILARFHLDAERLPGASGAAPVARVIEQVGSSLAQGARSKEKKHKAARWMSLAFSALAQRRAQLDARARHGGVRRCHGDLHLANICLIEGTPSPFDAIEFSDDLANIDILYDIAFLSMDLVRFGCAGLANLLLNRYLSITRDYAGSRLLDLFHSMRAAIRAMVLDLPGQPSDESERASAYLDLALAFLAGDAKPRLIAVGGFSGAGKSTLASALALDFDAPAGAIILQSDVIRKRMRGAPLDSRLAEAAYTDAEKRAVYERMMRDAGRALRAGRTVILDATFLDPEFRRAADALASETGVRFDGLWLTAARNVLAARLTSRTGGVSDATAPVLERQLQNASEPLDWQVCNVDRGLNETLGMARRGLASGAR